MSTSRRAAWAAAIAFGGIALTWLVTIAVLFAVEDARHQRAATGIREYNTGRYPPRPQGRSAMPEISDDDLATLIWCAMGHDRCLPHGDIPPGVLKALTPEWCEKVSEWVLATHELLRNASAGGSWLVSTDQPQAVTVSGERSAEKLAAKLNRLGLQATLYEAKSGGWEHRGWRGRHGHSFAQPRNWLKDGDVTTPRRVYVQRGDGTMSPCDVFRDPARYEGRPQWLAVPQDGGALSHGDWVKADYWPPGAVITITCTEGHPHGLGLDDLDDDEQ